MTATWQYWSFFNPTDNTTYVMPVNPNAMDAPEPDATITPTSGIHHGMWKPDMGYTTQQRVVQPRQWTFSGFTYTEMQHEDLWTWVNLPNKFQLTDHLDRTWTVIFTFYEALMSPTPRMPWRHRYTIHALIYGWPT